VFAQQSLQPKLSRRCYASVLYALQNNTVFRRAQNKSVQVPAKAVQKGTTS